MVKLKSPDIGYDKEFFYDLNEAVDIVKKVSSVKFDESVDLAIKLNVDPRHAEENIRISASLPNGTGKKVVILVLAQGDKVKEALDAGADYCGNKEYLDKLKLNEKSNVLLFGCEGLTDKAMYQKLLTDGLQKI